MTSLSESENENLCRWQNRVSDEQRQAQAESQIEQQKQALLGKNMTPEARQRLNNLKNG